MKMINLLLNQRCRMLLAGWILLSGCNGCSDTRKSQQEQVVTMDDLVRNNKRVHEQEMAAIAQYVKDKQWPTTQTATGLHYWIYENGTGEPAKMEDVVTLAYQIELLDGTKCYEASAQDPKHFRVGRDNVESGLHEITQILRKGDKAKVVLPSHLAFGLTGDSNKIPQNASVVYDVQILAIN
jgi:FKBP-type peptidyl-prolyl cis-trans isomerase FkpA